MKLEKVTISGIDEGTAGQDLLNSAEKYPFVEWGILLSSKKESSSR